MATTLFTQKLADEICEAISTSSIGLSILCKNNQHWPDKATILRWLEKHESFRDQYARAREAQADHLAEEIIAIADDGSKDTEIRYTASGEPYQAEDHEWVNRSKLRIEARKWTAAKLRPKVYGDKVDVTSGGNPIPAPQIHIMPKNE